MAARKPGRYLAPIALLLVAAAIFLVVKGHLHTSTKSSTSGQIPGTLVQSTRGVHSARHHQTPRTYKVKPGDTLSGISYRTGVGIGTITGLNPNVNPNALQTGQVLRLRR